MLLVAMAPNFCYVWKVFLVLREEGRSKLFHCLENVQSFHMAANSMACTMHDNRFLLRLVCGLINFRLFRLFRIVNPESLF